MSYTLSRRRFFQLGAVAAGSILASDQLLSGPVQAAQNDGRLGILYDRSKCQLCKVCVGACQTKNNLPKDQVFIKFKPEDEDNSTPIMMKTIRRTCQHCKDAACVKVCPTGATYKGPEGLTHFDRDKCAACGYCVEACPFGVPELTVGNKLDRRGDYASRCVGCPDLVSQGQPTACVQACPFQALTFGTWDELLANAQQRVAEVKGDFPDAQVYGENFMGSLGLIMVLPHPPEFYDLPPEPEIDTMLSIWKDLVRPGGLYLSGAALVGLGLTFAYARTNHLRELAEEEEDNK